MDDAADGGRPGREEAGQPDVVGPVAGRQEPHVAGRPEAEPQVVGRAADEDDGRGAVQVAATQGGVHERRPDVPVLPGGEHGDRPQRHDRPDDPRPVGALEGRRGQQAVADDRALHLGDQGSLAVDLAGLPQGIDQVRLGRGGEGGEVDSPDGPDVGGVVAALRPDRYARRDGRQWIEHGLMVRRCRAKGTSRTARAGADRSRSATARQAAAARGRRRQPAASGVPMRVSTRAGWVASQASISGSFATT